MHIHPENMIFASKFMPKGVCMVWQPDVIWLNTLSGIVISTICIAVSIMVQVFLNREKHKDRLHLWVIDLSSAFIFILGLACLVNTINIWYSFYYLEGALKVLTAAVAVSLVIAVCPILRAYLTQNTTDDVSDKGY